MYSNKSKQQNKFPNFHLFNTKRVASLYHRKYVCGWVLSNMSSNTNVRGICQYDTRSLYKCRYIYIYILRAIVRFFWPSFLCEKVDSTITEARMSTVQSCSSVNNWNSIVSVFMLHFPKHFMNVNETTAACCKTHELTSPHCFY